MLKRLVPPAMVVAALLATYLSARDDWPAVAATLASAGWALILVVALHVPQTLASAWSWRALSPVAGPGLARSYALRWVRDSINTLLPVAQVGGDVVRVRLLARDDGQALPVVAGTTVVDISLEVLAQVAFTVGAVILLIAQKGLARGAASTVAVATLVGCAAIVALLVVLRRSDPIGRLDRLAVRRLWPGASGLAGVGAAVDALHAHPRRMVACMAGHVIAWVLGALETYVALRVIGVEHGVGAAIVIEALGHAARAVGFFIPGALGVQEGGYVLVCGLYGIAAPAALSLSAIKRIREVALGVPGLALWAWIERHGAAPVAADAVGDDKNVIPPSSARHVD